MSKPNLNPSLKLSLHTPHKFYSESSSTKLPPLSTINSSQSNQIFLNKHKYKSEQLSHIATPQPSNNHFFVPETLPPDPTPLPSTHRKIRAIGADSYQFTSSYIKAQHLSNSIEIGSNLIDNQMAPKISKSGVIEVPLTNRISLHEMKKRSSPKKFNSIQVSLSTPSTARIDSKFLTPLKLKTNVMEKENALLMSSSLLLSPNSILPVNLLPNIEPSKCSQKKNGLVKGYAANTHQGLIRGYNEDRVAIILNMAKPNRKEGVWPACSFFAIYDGHGGMKCAEFLRDNLHHYVVTDNNFPSNPKLAIKHGFHQAEKSFLEMVQTKNAILERSGSCAIVVMIVDGMCYVANVGDSRALMSKEKGSKIIPLSKDHKPEIEEEKKRIVEAGGQVYQSQTQILSIPGASGSTTTKAITGPFRVLPGRLSVSRTFGDAEAKLKLYGGNPNVIIAEPDIKSFEITSEDDFIILGCDGIFDKLNNKEACRSIWETGKHCKFENIHEFTARAVENLMREALLHKTLDNITVVMISFKSLKDSILGKKRSIHSEKRDNDIIEFEYIHERMNDGREESRLEHKITKQIKKREGN